MKTSTSDMLGLCLQRCVICVVPNEVKQLQTFAHLPISLLNASPSRLGKEFLQLLEIVTRNTNFQTVLEVKFHEWIWCSPEPRSLQKGVFCGTLKNILDKWWTAKIAPKKMASAPGKKRGRRKRWVFSAENTRDVFCGMAKENKHIRCLENWNHVWLID